MYLPVEEKPAEGTANAPVADGKPPAEAEKPRAAEGAVLDEVASLKKQMADLAAFVGFGRPPPPPPPAPAPAARPAGVPTWLNPWAAA